MGCGEHIEDASRPAGRLAFARRPRSRPAVGSLQTSAMNDWFEDETLWESLDDFLFDVLRTPAGTLAEVEQMVSLLQLTGGKRFSTSAAGRVATRSS